MPRDKARRPRRKAKNEDEAETFEQNSQSNQNEQDKVIQPDMPNQMSGNSQFNDMEGSGRRPQDVEPAAFGLVDTEIKQYFKSIESALDDKENIPEDLNLLVDSAFGEITGKEFILSVDHECSRVMEKLICVAPAHRILTLFNTLNEKLLTLLTHRFASHVCQTLLISVAAVVEKEVKGIPVKFPEDLKKDLGSLPTMESLVISACEKLSGRWSELIFNPFASHVLRVLLQVLHGSPIEDSNTTNTIIKSKKSKGYMASKSGGAFVAPKLSGTRLVPASFKDILGSVINELLFNTPEVILRSTVLHNTASPVIQLLLQIKYIQGNLQEVDDLVDKLLQGIPSENDITAQGTKLRNPFVLTMLKDSVGSHLFEKIVKFISTQMFNRLYLLYFRGSLLELSFHAASNFVIQNLVANARSIAQLELMISEVIPSFERLLRMGRPGIIRSFIDACVNLDGCYKHVLKGLTQAFGANTASEQKDFIYLALLMQSYKTFKSTPKSERPKYHTQGSTLLQSLLKFPEPHSDLVINSVLAQSPEDMLALALDYTSNFILDAMISSKTINLKVKRLILKTFESNFHLLAVDKIGSRLLDTCWAVADIKLKESIAIELVNHESLLASSFFGKFVLRNCRIENFKHKREEWAQKEEGSVRKKEVFKDLFEGDDEKTLKAMQKRSSTKTDHPNLPNHLKEQVNSDVLKSLGVDNGKSNHDEELIVSESAEIDALFKKAPLDLEASTSLPNPAEQPTDKKTKSEKKAKKSKRKDDDITDVLSALATSSGKKALSAEEPPVKKVKSKKEKKDKEALRELVAKSSSEVQKKNKKSKKDDQDSSSKKRKFTS